MSNHHRLVVLDELVIKLSLRHYHRWWVRAMACGLRFLLILNNLHTVAFNTKLSVSFIWNQLSRGKLKAFLDALPCTDLLSGG